MDQRNDRNVLFISLSQFGIAFSFNFVMVFFPFLIHDISPYSPRETLIWVGLIMAAPSFVAALASTFWGSLTSRFSSKLLYMRGLLSHAILVVVMGFVTSLPILLLLRMLQGVLGGISTLGLFIVSSSSSKERVSRDIGFFQNSMTLGQLIGPPMGALAASTLGYRGAFISASALIFSTLAFCFFYVAEVPHEPSRRPSLGKHTMNRRTLIGWGVCFTATVQLMFLPSVLPNVFQAFKVGETIALKWAGQVVMFYTATAMVGTYLLCRVAGKMRNHRLIMTVGTLGLVFQSLLCVSPGIISFVAVRMLQTAMIAALVPLIFSSFASDLDGRVIGFLNSSRFAGNALGPLIATFVLAFSSLTSLYLSVSGLSLLALLGFAFYFGSPEASVGERGS
jgi:MFS family permease